MTRRRVIQMVVTSWGIPFLFILILVSTRLIAIDRIMAMLGYLCLLFEIILCVILIFFLASMFLVVYNLNSRDRNLAKQLRFNQMVAKAKTQNTSAVKWVALITCVFLSCYGIMMRCSLLFLIVQSCDDFRYKIPLQVINSGINPIVNVSFAPKPTHLSFLKRWLILCSDDRCSSAFSSTLQPNALHTLKPL